MHEVLRSNDDVATITYLELSMLKCRRFRWQHLLPSSQIFGLKVGMQQEAAERKLSATAVA